MTSKHKHKTNTHSTPEKDRIPTHNVSLNVSNTVEERTDETSFSGPDAEDPIPDFKHHEPLQHISSPLTSTHNPSTIWTCYICKKGFNEFEYRKNHMIEVHNFQNIQNACIFSLASPRSATYFVILQPLGNLVYGWPPHSHNVLSNHYNGFDINKR